jgi:hypothetical protein
MEGHMNGSVFLFLVALVLLIYWMVTGVFPVPMFVLRHLFL